MTPLSEIPLEGRLTRPAKHGWALDYSTPEGRRVHVRVFAFEEGYVEGVACELPSALSREAAVEMLRGAVQRMTTTEGAENTEGMRGGSHVTDAAQRVPTSDDGALGTMRPTHNPGALGTTLPTGEESDAETREISERVEDYFSKFGQYPPTQTGALLSDVVTIRRVLFLDVDGVLNTRPGSLDMDKISLVREIVDATGAKVVISSSWRTVPEQMVRLKRALSAVGIEPIGRTPCFDHSNEPGLKMTYPRWKEVRAWLEENPGVDQYVILDDLADMMTMNSRFVRVHGDVGLQPANVEQALLKFRRQAIEAGDVLTPAAERLQEEEEGGADL